jgi:ribonuclease PH
MNQGKEKISVEKRMVKRNTKKEKEHKHQKAKKRSKDILRKI